MWHKIGDKFSDVSVSVDGEYWALGSTQSSYDGYDIYFYQNQKWNKLSEGGAVRIAAFQQGEIWTVTSVGSVYQRLGGKWIKRAEPYTASDIAVGQDGIVWITCT